MKADLHIHTWHSTGTQTPEEAIREAVSKGIGLISFTDDDTTAAYDGLAEIATRHGVSYIHGIQVSAMRKGLPFRLLAYDSDPAHPDLRRLLAANRDAWNDFGGRIIGLLSEEQPELSVDEYEAHCKDPRHGGFKVNSYLHAKGLDGSERAFVERLVEHREAVLQLAPTLGFSSTEAVIRIIHDAGGKAILPGGYLRNAETFTADLDSLVPMGLDGLERFSPSYDVGMARAAREYAEQHQLLITGGGDGHGSWASQEKYAIGIEDIDVDALNLGPIRVHHPSR